MRWFIVLGIVLIVAGIGLSIYTSASTISQSFAGGSDFNADMEARAEELCREGERLDIVEGAPSRNTDGTYGRPQTYYCIDSDGTRRDVTGDFVNSLLGDIPGVLSSIPGFNTGVLGGLGFMALTCLGVVFLVIGIFGSIINGTRRMAARTQSAWGTPMSSGTFSTTAFNSTSGSMPPGVSVSHGPDGSIRIDMSGMMAGTGGTSAPSQYGFDFPGTDSGADQPVSVSGGVVVTGGNVMPIQDMNEVAELMNLMQLPVSEVVNRMNQLEEARRAGRVTEEQYNRMREIMLRALNRG